jgi:putative ABC transport system permease protein
MLRMSLRSLLARRRRLAGTAVAIVLGISFLSGTLVLGDTLSTNFDELVGESLESTDVVVRNSTDLRTGDVDSQRGLIAASLLAEVQAVDGVAHAEGQVVGTGQILGSDGEPVGGSGAPRLAGSWVANEELNPYRIVEGRAPETPDDVVIDRGAADDGTLSVGDQTIVQTPTPTEVTIVGIATFGDADDLGGSTWAAWTLEGAQRHVTGQPDQITSVLVAGEAGVNPDELRQRIASVLPDGAEAAMGTALVDERLDEISGFLDPLRLFLVVFGGIALVVAALSINNSYSVTVAQRTRELALLRAVGATRKQVRRIVSLEALLLGVVASAIAIPLGWGVAGLLTVMFDAFGFGGPTGGLEIRPTSVIVTAAAGVVATLGAAQAAARRSSRLAPLAALRDTSIEAAGIGARRLGVGAAVAIGGLSLSVGGALTGSVPAAGIGALATVVATLILAPAMLPPVASVIGAGLRRWRGLTGELAEQNTQRSPRRSAATGASLVVGVAVVTLITVLVTSMQTTFVDDVATDFAADLAVAVPGVGDAQLDTALVDDLEGLPEVDSALGLGGGQVLLDGDETTVTSAHRAGLEEVAGLEAQEGSLASLGHDELAASQSRADDEGWDLGTNVEMTFSDGTTESLRVAAIFEDTTGLEIRRGRIRGQGGGDLVIQPELWAAHTAQPVHQAVLLNLAGDVGLGEGQDAVEPLADRYGGEVRDRDDYASAAGQSLDLMLGVVYVLLALAIIIALLGIANTLALAVHERRHEIGLLRAVGQTRRQVRSVLRLEALIVSTFGTLVGLALGGFLGWALFSMVTEEDGGSFTVPGGRLVTIALVGAIAGVLAAQRPARRAAQLPILDAIADT